MICQNHCASELDDALHAADQDYKWQSTESQQQLLTKAKYTLKFLLEGGFSLITFAKTVNLNSCYT